MASRGSQTERDLDLDDWFAETDLAQRRPRRPVARSDEGPETLEDPQAADDWLARNTGRGEESPRPGGFSLTSPRLWLALAAVAALVVIGLFVGGVFNGSKHPTPTGASQGPQTPTASTPSTKTTPKTAKTPTPVAVPTIALKPGDAGTQVKKLQRALAALGYSPGAVDGRYGPATRRAVQRFQKAKKLTADGLYGPKTFRALGSAASR